MYWYQKGNAQGGLFFIDFSTIRNLVTLMQQEKPTPLHHLLAKTIGTKRFLTDADPRNKIAKLTLASNMVTYNKVRHIIVAWDTTDIDHI